MYYESTGTGNARYRFEGLFFSPALAANKTNTNPMCGFRGHGSVKLLINGMSLIFVERRTRWPMERCGNDVITIWCNPVKLL